MISHEMFARLSIKVKWWDITVGMIVQSKDDRIEIGVTLQA